MCKAGSRSRAARTAVSIGMALKVDFVPTPSASGEALGVPRFVPA